MPRLSPAGSTLREAVPPVPLGQCDATASGAENALVRLVKDDQALCLCGSHYHRKALALTAAGWAITQDDRSWHKTLPV
jgi:hypothetical protein